MKFSFYSLLMGILFILPLACMDDSVLKEYDEEQYSQDDEPDSYDTVQIGWAFTYWKGVYGSPCGRNNNQHLYDILPLPPVLDSGNCP